MKGNSIIVNGNIINSQIQQGTYGSNQNNGFGMGLEACIMLFYAAENEVDIKVVTTLSGTGYYTGKILLNESQSKRELARWEAAKKQLLANGYIEQAGPQGVLFQVTDLGYRVSDGFKEGNDLDVSMSPAELMKIFAEVDETVEADDDNEDGLFEPNTEYAPMSRFSTN